MVLKKKEQLPKARAATMPRRTYQPKKAEKAEKGAEMDVPSADMKTVRQIS